MDRRARKARKTGRLHGPRGFGGFRLSPPDAARAIEERLAAAGLPPLPRTAWAEIDLDALASNLAILRARAGSGVPVHPVVKGDAYGHGAVPVARSLLAAGAEGLCVAVIDEALVLREGGIEAPILILYPVPAAYLDEARDAGIAITASDRALLVEMVAKVGSRPDGPPLEVQLEVETGLGRGGFGPADAFEAARSLADAPGIRLAGAWTHLQAPEDDARSRRQVEAFEAITREIEARGVDLGRRHLAASGSLLLGETVSLDGVRPGLATYGLVPDELLEREPARDAGLRPILSLKARPVRVTELPAGTGISYGPTFTTSRPSRIATLPLGYGDGWSRALSNRAEALVRGRRVPIVGNVAMDGIMADVTDVPGAPVTVDDEFVLIGAQGEERITVPEIAAARGTNSWELVTNLAARLPRVYHAASVPQATRTLVSDDAGGRRSKRA